MTPLLIRDSSDVLSIISDRSVGGSFMGIGLYLYNDWLFPCVKVGSGPGAVSYLNIKEQ